MLSVEYRVAAARRAAFRLRKSCRLISGMIGPGSAAGDALDAARLVEEVEGLLARIEMRVMT